MCYTWALAYLLTIGILFFPQLGIHTAYHKHKQKLLHYPWNSTWKDTLDMISWLIEHQNQRGPEIWLGKFLHFILVFSVSAISEEWKVAVHVEGFIHWGICGMCYILFLNYLFASVWKLSLLPININSLIVLNKSSSHLWMLPYTLEG